MNEKNGAGVAHATPELPKGPGVVIVPADGREYIEAVINGVTHRTRMATASWAGGWYGAWRPEAPSRGIVPDRHIAPGTWKVADQ